MKIFANLILFIFILLTSCKDEDQLPLIEEQAFQLDASEHLLGIGIRAGAEWKVEGDTTWCKRKIIHRGEKDSLFIEVAVNLLETSRETTWRIFDRENTEEIKIQQAGATEEYHYRLPIVFHIFTPRMEPEYIDRKLEDHLLDVLAKANAFYAGRNRKKIDVNVEFVPATTTPTGEQLERPGIHWELRAIYKNINQREFINNIYHDADSLWDLKKYINVYIFKFDNGTDATAAMPYTPEHNALEGLLIDDRFYRNYPPEDFAPCITLNRSRLYGTDTIPGSRKNRDIITFIHEMGHYLGLFHAFSTGEEIETDYCEDTPDYNRSAYSSWLLRHPYSPLKEKLQRTDRNNSVFISTNIEDYLYSYQDEITSEQRKRIRHVLNYSPMMPGPKIPVPLHLESKTGRKSPHGIICD